MHSSDDDDGGDQTRAARQRQGMHRLDLATEAWLRFRAGEEGDSVERFLARYGGLRDLLGPMLGETDEPDEALRAELRAALGRTRVRRDPERSGESGAGEHGEHGEHGESGESG